jgi:hypothetical protein
MKLVKRGKIDFTSREAQQWLIKAILDYSRLERLLGPNVW